MPLEDRCCQVGLRKTGFKICCHQEVSQTEKDTQVKMKRQKQFQGDYFDLHWTLCFCVCLKMSTIKRKVKEKWCLWKRDRYLKYCRSFLWTNICQWIKGHRQNEQFPRKHNFTKLKVQETLVLTWLLKQQLKHNVTKKIVDTYTFTSEFYQVCMEDWIATL